MRLRIRTLHLANSFQSFDSTFKHLEYLSAASPFGNCKIRVAKKQLLKRILYYDSYIILVRLSSLPWTFLRGTRRPLSDTHFNTSFHLRVSNHLGIEYNVTETTSNKFAKICCKALRAKGSRAKERAPAKTSNLLQNLWWPFCRRCNLSSQTKFYHGSIRRPRATFRSVPCSAVSDLEEICSDVAAQSSLPQNIQSTFFYILPWNILTPRYYCSSLRIRTSTIL